MPATTFSLDELDEYEELAASAQPVHLRSARIYILALCQEAGIQVGILGGYSLMLRGSRRQTTDIDLYFDSSMSNLQSLVDEGDRIIRPDSGLAADVYRIYVRTAGGWDDIGADEQLVEVDIMPQGGLADGGIEIIYADDDDQEVPVIDIASMLRNKLRAFEARESANDLFDIQWLINEYPDIVAETRDDTNYGYRERFIEALYENDMAPEDIELYQIALDVIWPPTEE